MFTCNFTVLCKSLLHIFLGKLEISSNWFIETFSKIHGNTVYKAKTGICTILTSLKVYICYDHLCSSTQPEHSREIRHQASLRTFKALLWIVYYIL